MTQPLSSEKLERKLKIYNEYQKLISEAYAEYTRKTEPFWAEYTEKLDNLVAARIMRMQELDRKEREP